MKISIAIATFNGDRYLEAQLKSFLDQTLLPDEIIICDDCSHDKTEQIIYEFISEAPFVVEYYKNENNLGYCGNFNKALSKTTGDLIFLSDQDDVWYPEKLQWMVKVAKQNPDALMVMNDAAFTDQELRSLGLTKLGQIKSAGLSMNTFMMGCCSGVRRELLEMCLPIPPEYNSHDRWLSYFADGLKKKHIEDKVLQLYRRHDTNESQALINRPTKLGKQDVLLAELKRIFDPEAKTQDIVSMNQLTLFESGIRKAICKASPKHTASLERMLTQVNRTLELRKARVEIWTKPMIKRLPAIVRLAQQGGYKRLGWKSAIFRDLFGL